jgi:hypothetical protein
MARSTAEGGTSLSRGAGMGDWTRSTWSPRSMTMLRACCATHARWGAVILARGTRRHSTSTTNTAYSRVSPTVSTVKKYHQTQQSPHCGHHRQLPTATGR